MHTAISSVILAGCLAAAPLPEPPEVDDPEAMQALLLDTRWMHSRHVWRFDPTGRFSFVIEPGTRRPRVPAGFPEDTIEREDGEPTVFTGRWRVREDGLRLSVVRPDRASRWRADPAEEHEPPDPVESGITLGLAWIGEKRNDRRGRQLRIDRLAHQQIAMPGPVPLRSLDHLRASLGRTSWVGPVQRDAALPPVRQRDGVPLHHWAFRGDGTFATWIDPPPPIAGIFAGEESRIPWRYEGRWSIEHEPPEGVDLMFSLNANPSDLVLREVTPTPPGSDNDTIVLPVNWVDGKLRMEIDGKGFMRSVSR